MEASESMLTREQTAHGSIRIHARYSWLLSGPRRGWNRFLRTGTLRFGGRPRDNRTLRRNGTRLLTTITSVFSWRKSARPRSNGILSRAFCVYGVGTKLRTTESGRRTPLRSASKSCSACGCRTGSLCSAVLVAAEHRLPVRTVHPGSHGLLRHRIQDLGGPDIRLFHGVGLLYDLDSLGLHQTVDAHFTAGAGSDLPVGGELKGRSRARHRKAGGDAVLKSISRPSMSGTSTRPRTEIPEISPCPSSSTAAGSTARASRAQRKLTSIWFSWWRAGRSSRKTPLVGNRSIIYTDRRIYAYMMRNAVSESETTRLTITWSKEADHALRTFLGSQGMKKGDLSRFIEEAVRWRIFHQTVREAREAFADVSPDELQKMIDEAVEDARAKHYRERAKRS